MGGRNAAVLANLYESFFFQAKKDNFILMKIDLQYLNDKEGKTQAVQLSLNDWGKLLTKLKKYEQALKLKSDLTEAFEQVQLLKNKKGHKQTLKEFLNEL